MPRRPTSTRIEIELRQEAERWKTTAVLLRSELEAKCGYAGRLEFLLAQRSKRIDDLTGKLDQVRAQNRRLDEEAERLAAMVWLPPSFIVG